MTCIVGIEHGGRVWIGGDSIAVDDSQDSVILDSSKVFPLMDGEMLVGHSGGLRDLQALKYGLGDLMSPIEGREEAWLCVTFANAVREAFRRFGALSIENGVEKTGSFLIGLRGKVYLFEDSCGLVRDVKGYAALGCGAKYALGALSVLSAFKLELSPRRIVELALGAAVEHNAWVKGPFTILSSGTSGTSGSSVDIRPLVTP